MNERLTVICGAEMYAAKIKLFGKVPRVRRAVATSRLASTSLNTLDAVERWPELKREDESLVLYA